jgi:hypothetical protein
MSRVSPPEARIQRKRGDDDAKQAFDNMLEQCTVLAVCGRKYILTKKLQEWFRSTVHLDPKSRDRTTTQAERLLYHIYRKHDQTIDLPLGPANVLRGRKCCLLVFSILLQLGHGHQIDKFQEMDLIDRRLPIDVHELGKKLSDDLKLAEDFDGLQWQYCPDTFDLEMNGQYHQKRVIPICRKKTIKKGGTAEVWQIVVQAEFVGDKLKESVQDDPLASFDDPKYGKVTIGNCF